MKRLQSCLLAVIAAGAIGCSGAATLKETPISVSGSVSQNGLPVGGLVVWFHPLDKGHLVSLPVNADGTFAGELITGDYSYYVGSSAVPSSAKALAKVDPKYYQPVLERRVNVEFGQKILLALD